MPQQVIRSGATIFVVMGSTGEYSDRNEWSVAAFLDEAQAEERVRLASERAREIEQNRSGPRHSKWDHNFRMDYNGTRYHILKVPYVGPPLKAEPPEPGDPPTTLWDHLKD